MRVLLYNWVDYLDDESRGGGVSVYLRSLMAALEADPGIEANMLSSGISYDLRRRAPRWERLRHGPERDRARRYEIVNSGVLSPAHHSFGNPAQTRHGPTRDAFYDFIAETGPYDVIHFHNLEGLPAEVLGLKRLWPETRVILTLHNYYPVCPQVNLWHRERAACVDFDGGRKCVTCLPHKHDERLVRLADALAYRLKCAGIRPGTRAFDLAFRQSMRVGGRLARAGAWLRAQLRNRTARRDRPPPTADFAARRAEMVDRINTGCDLVLGVSDRVCEIAERYGVDPLLLHSSYIGSSHAARFAETAPAPSLPRPDGTLGIAYLGYMRRDKGFFFLLDALEALPDAMAARLHLLVGARNGPPEAMARLEALRPRLAGLRHLDGYDPERLDEVLEGTDLGVVPVLWEDNLPQVAIEMHARHIPLLTSDMGGAQELGQCPGMVFRAGDTADFTARLSDVLEGRLDLAAYWAGARAPVGMEAHLEAMKRLYKGEIDPDRVDRI